MDNNELFLKPTNNVDHRDILAYDFWCNIYKLNRETCEIKHDIAFQSYDMKVITTEFMEFVYDGFTFVCKYTITSNPKYKGFIGTVLALLFGSYNQQINYKVIISKNGYYVDSFDKLATWKVLLIKAYDYLKQKEVNARIAFEEDCRKLAISLK